MNREDGFENGSVFHGKVRERENTNEGEQHTPRIETGEHCMGLLEEGERGRGLWNMDIGD